MKLFTSKTQKTGEKGEDTASQYLKEHGYHIVERNVANKFGEIDIVAKRGSTYYFFEVKAGYAGAIRPAENLHPAKLRKFLTSVEYYCYCKHISDYRAQGIIVTFSQKVEVEILDLS